MTPFVRSVPSVLSVLSVLFLALSGCVAEPHRRLNEHNRLRGERIAASEAAPPEVRQDGAEVAAASKALQRQAVPAPKTPVQGTSEELREDLARAGIFDAALERFKAWGKGLLTSLASSSGAFGGAAATALAIAGWLARQKKRVEEAGNRIATTYRENVPADLRAQIDQKLASVLAGKGLPVKQAEKFVGWENVPD